MAGLHLGILNSRRTPSPPHASDRSGIIIIEGRRLWRLSKLLSVLFTPWLMIGMSVVALVIVVGTVASSHASGELWSTTKAERLVAIAIAIATLLVHELGHAAAAARHRQIPLRVGLVMYGGLFPSMFVDIRAMHRPRPVSTATVAGAGSTLQLLAAAVLCTSAFLAPDVRGLLVMASLATSALALVQLLPFPGSDGAELIAALK